MYSKILVLVAAFVLALTLTVRAETFEQEFNKEFTPSIEYGFKENSWTTWNKSLLTTYVLANVADVYTTQEALDRGCVEGNPLMPTSVVGSVLVKAGVGVGMYYLVEKVLVPKYGTSTRNWWYGINTVITSAVSISNNSCGR